MIRQQFCEWWDMEFIGRKHTESDEAEVTLSPQARALIYISAAWDGAFRHLGTRVPLYREAQFELTHCCGCDREVAWYARRCPRCAIHEPGRRDPRWLRRASRRGQLRVGLSAAVLAGLFW